MIVSSFPTTTMLATVLCVGVAAAASSSCTEILGNYYCDETSQITYANVGFDGSYNDVTSFDSSSCTCGSEKVSFSGSLAPLNEELSVHFRGPLNLKQFAHYTIAASSSKKKRAVVDDEADLVVEAAVNKPHLHHNHKRDVYVTQLVSITTTVYEAQETTTPAADDAAAAVDNAAAVDDAASFSSNVVDVTVNEYVHVGDGTTSAFSTGPATTAAAAATTSAAYDTTSEFAALQPAVSSSDNVVESVVNAATSKLDSIVSEIESVVASSSAEPTSTTSSASSASSASSSSAAASSTATTGDWSRAAYYSSDSKSSNGLVFLNNQGGVNGSGVWDTCFGNSLSYCGSDGVSAAADPQVLADVTIPSNKEFTIYTDSECGTNGGECGYYRPGTPAYHGFGGDNYKLFLFEFSMPSDSGSSAAINADMPAIWMLNAKIPRTVQYGPTSCSCWGSGCGEFDIFEVLNSGNARLTSHLHSGQGSSDPSGSYGGGGSANYIARPTDKTMKAAVLFSGSEVTITVLDDSVEFGETVTAETVEGWINSDSAASVSGSTSLASTVFTLAD